MKRTVILSVVLALLCSAVYASGLVRLPTGAPITERPTAKMQLTSTLPTPEIVGISDGADKPTVLWLDSDRQIDLPIIWRNSSGQIVECPFEFSVSAFSDDGKLRDVQIRGNKGSTLRLTTTRRGAQWMTVIVSCYKLGLTWTRSAWVSWGDNRYSSSWHKN